MATFWSQMILTNIPPLIFVATDPVALFCLLNLNPVVLNRVGTAHHTRVPLDNVRGAPSYPFCDF